MVNGQSSILCIFPWLALGGADKFNLDLLGELRGRGWQCSIATTLPGAHPWRAAFAAQASQIVDMASLPAAQQPGYLLALAERTPPDVLLVSHSSMAYQLLPYLRAHLPQTAFVDYCHMEDMAWRNGGYPAMSLAAGQHLDLRIVSSQHLRDWMCQRGADPQRVAVCTTNIDSQRWNSAHYDRAALRAALGIAPDATVVLYAARLERQKQPVLRQ